MATEEMLLQYNNLVRFYVNVNALIEVNDRYLSILKDDLPDPNDAEDFRLESENDRNQEIYSSFYFTRRRLFRLVDRVSDKFVDFLKVDPYKELDDLLTEMWDRLQIIDNVRNMKALIPMRNTLLAEAEEWSKSLEKGKDVIDSERRKLVNKNAPEQKNDPSTDSQTVSEQRNAGAMRLKDASMQTVSKEVSVDQVREDRLEDIREKITEFKFLKQSFTNLTNSNLIKRWSDNIQNAPTWLRSALGIEVGVTGVSPIDGLLGKFTIQNLRLRRKIRKSGAFELDTDRTEAYWRKRIRKKYGKRVPFCDERVVLGSDGKSVSFEKKDEFAAQQEIVAAQERLLLDFYNRTPDEH